MRIANKANGARVGLWQRTALELQQALRWLAQQKTARSENAYLLHPRCCRTEIFRGELP